MVQQLADIIFYIFLLFIIVTPVLLAYRLVNRDTKKPEHSIDYYVNNPFPDEEEAGIVEVQEEAFVVIPETDPDSLKEARESKDWPEWERAIQVELDQLKCMGTWQLVEKPEGAVPIGNK